MQQFLSIGFLAGLNLILAFSGQWYIFVTLGPGLQTDAYFASLAITTTSFTVLLGGLANILVPVLLELPKSRKAAITSGVLLTTLGVSAVFSVFLGSSASWWTPLLLPGFGEEAQSLVQELAFMLAVAAGLQATVHVMGAVHRARQAFLWPEISTLAGNGVFLVGLWLFLQDHGVIAAVWATLLRVLISGLVVSRGVRLSTYPRFPSSTYRRIWSQYRHLLFGASIYKTGPVVDRYFASNGPAGTVTLLGFALQLYQMFLFIVEKGLAAPLVTKAALHAREETLPELRKDYLHAAMVALLMALSLWTVVWLAGSRGLELLVGYGSVTTQNIQSLMQLMLVLGAMPVAGIFGQLAAACLYGLGATAKVTRVGIINFFIAVGMKFLLFWQFGLIGLAIGIVAYQLLNAIVLHGIVMRLGRY